MPTNPNMAVIQTVTVGNGGAATIEFTSIPQTYTDLYIVASTRATQTDTPVKVEFNNVTTGYSWRRIFGSGSTASSLSGTDAYYFWTATSSQTASTFGLGQLYIPNYTSSNNKSISTESLNENNGTAADMFITAALWSNSAAITSIKLTPLTGSFVQYSTATLYGVTSSAYGAKATGGIISETDTHWIHTFTSSGTFTPSQNLTDVEYLVIAGGGGGADDRGGAGGAGGYRCSVVGESSGGGASAESRIPMTNGTAYTVTVGGGGAGASINNQASSGTSSSISGSGFTTISTTGGGGGGSASNSNASSNNGLTGGSGGGAGNGSASGTASGGSGTANQGYAGGSSQYTPNYRTGGGGGAGGVGGNGTGSTGGNGGNGLISSITGTAIARAGGGAGNYAGSGTVGTGGTAAGTAGAANSGAGAGGAANVAGGSGIVIIRYAK